MDEERSRQSREGFRAWLGVLDAFREAIEETIDEMKQRGQFSPDRAKEAVRESFRRAQAAAGEVRERLDFVSRREFDELRVRVDDLRARVDDILRRVDELSRGGAGGGATPPTAGE